MDKMALAPPKDELLWTVLPAVFPIWRPDPAVPVVKQKGDYQPLTDIERVLHFEDFLDVFHNHSILPNPLTNASHSRMPRAFSGTWFGPAKTGTENNWYGNVSCRIPFQVFLNFFNPRCYFTEVIDFNTMTSARLLFTTKDTHCYDRYSLYDPTVYGGPWYKDGEGEHWFLTDTRRFKNLEENSKGTTVEMFIVLEEEEYENLFAMSKQVPVNHAEGNFQNFYKCRKYRSGGRNELCPSPWSIEECQMHLEEFYDGCINAM